MCNSECKKTLKKVGIVLIVVGIVDISYMVWCIIHKVNYSSSFNIFAVIAGIFLLRGSLRATKITAVFCGLLLGSAILSPLFCMIYPFELLMLYFKFYKSYVFLGISFIIVLIILLSWIYHQLNSDSVINALKENGIYYKSFWRTPYAASICGAIILIVLTSMGYILQFSEDAKKAISIVQEERGTRYKYFVNSIHTQSFGGKTTVTAVVTAYNSNEIKEIKIEW